MSYGTALGHKGGVGWAGFGVDLFLGRTGRREGLGRGWAELLALSSICL